MKLPTGYRIVWAGEFEELQQAKARLEIIVPISLLMILVLLYGLFNSLRDSLLVLAGIPFAAGGGIVALYLSGLDFSISAAVGFVSLFGVSVMNGILVMTYYNEIRAGGMGTIEAMFHAAEQRMRPMLMTALSACIGLLPAAVSTGIGSQVQRPLATVVVGGMFIGPIILLVVVPALQTFLPRREPRDAAGHAQRCPAERVSVMPTVSGVRIGLYFSAIVLVGALTTLPVFAEDAGSSGARDEQRQHSGEDAAGNAAKPDQSVPRDDKAATPEGQRLPDAERDQSRRPNSRKHRYAQRRAAAPAKRQAEYHRRHQRQAGVAGGKESSSANVPAADRLPIPWCATRSACRSRRAKAGSNMTGSIPML